MKFDPSSVFTLADLDSWTFAGTALAVIGQPIKHSISPALHNAALAEMQRTDPRFAGWRYFRFEIAPETLAEALGKFHERKFHGLNLTVPHKVLAIPSLAKIEPGAAAIGAVNTLRWSDQGWHGFNTDGHGLQTGIRDDLGLSLAGAHILLLGAGGAARGAAVQCLQQGCASLAIVNRSGENLKKLLDQMRPLAGATPLAGSSPTEAASIARPGSLVINATSAGLRTDDPLPVELRGLPRPAAVYDMIYNPRETPLLRTARELGVPAANGLSMLVHQGARALEIWSDSAVPVATMQTAAQAALPN